MMPYYTIRIPIYAGWSFYDPIVYGFPKNQTNKIAIDKTKPVGSWVCRKHKPAVRVNRPLTQRKILMGRS